MASFFEFIGEQWLLVGVWGGLVAAYIAMEKRRSGQSISIAEMTRLINAGDARVIDIREPKEYRAGHITGAESYPHSSIADHYDEFLAEPECQLILVDKMGHHSSHIGKQMTSKGIRILRLHGGMTEWYGRNLPVVKA